MLRILSISILLSFLLATPVLAADSDEGFISKSWHSITSYFTDEKAKEKHDGDDLHDDDATITSTPVADTVPPTIKIQQTAITVEAVNVQSIVNLGVVTAVDLVDGVVPVSNNAPASFPLGITTVTYIASDAAGNTSTATQNVVVQDTTPPVLTALAAVSANSTTGQPLAVNIGTATATDAFVPVTITNNAPATFPIGNTTVTWTAVDANNNSTTATQLVTVNDTSIFTNLPPNPGAAGKITLAGIDSDNDGLRDDVQRWIVMTYPNSQKTRAAFRQLAVDYQNAILDVTSKAVARNNFISMQRSMACLHYVRADYYDIVQSMEPSVLNTSVRSRAFLRWSYLLSGGIYKGIARGTQNCNFAPNAMPN